MSQDREDEQSKKDQEISSLRRNIEKLSRERDDITLRFQEEKQKSMMLGKVFLAETKIKLFIRQDCLVIKIISSYPFEILEIFYTQKFWCVCTCLYCHVNLR